MNICDNSPKKLTEEQEKLIEEINKSHLNEKSDIQRAINIYHLKKSLLSSSWTDSEFKDYIKKMCKYRSDKYLSHLCTIGEFCLLIKEGNLPLPFTYAQIEPIIECIPRREDLRYERIPQMITLWDNITKKENLDKLTKNKIIFYLVEWEKNSGLYDNQYPYRVSNHQSIEMESYDELQKQLTDEQKNMVKEIEELKHKKENIKLAEGIYNLKKSLISWRKNKFNNFGKKVLNYSGKHIKRLYTIGEFCQYIRKKNLPLPTTYSQIEPIIACIPSDKKRRPERLFRMVDLWADITEKEDIKNLTREVIGHYITIWKRESGQYEKIKSNVKRKRNDGEH